MPPVAIHLAPAYLVCRSGIDRLYCLNYTNTRGELACTRFTYDDAGLNTRAFYQQISGGRSSRNSHEFDQKGRVIRKDRAYNDGETSTECFEYGPDGRLIRETFENSKGKPGETRYIYDKAGNAFRMECTAYKGWLNGALEFDFDADGRRLAGRLIIDDIPAGSIEYAYESSGNLLREHWDFGGTWSQTFAFVYESA